jgi:hypothetical protein
MNPAITGKWAKAQDRVFEGEAEPESIFEFWPIGLAQEKITPTNLTLRNRLIMADTVTGGLQKAHVAAAISQFNVLRHNGYWKESASYWAYTRTGLEWYRNRHWLPGEVVQAMNELDASYRAISAPDGSIPLPECSVGGWGAPYEQAHMVSTPSYFCKRWKEDGKVTAYLLIALDADPEPRRNLHHHLEAGYFAFWGEVGRAMDFDWKTAVPHKLIPPAVKTKPIYGWLHRCKPYTSFNFQESLTSSSLAECLPKGALPPTWRAKPPRVKSRMEVLADHTIFWFSWQTLPFVKITREIHVLSDRVIVKEGGTLRKSKIREYRA